jgi:hypothetical protein
MPKIELNDRELATVVAALRYWQADVDDDFTLATDGVIATDGRRLAPLTVHEIEVLCERLSTEE